MHANQPPHAHLRVGEHEVVIHCSMDAVVVGCTEGQVQTDKSHSDQEEVPVDRAVACAEAGSAADGAGSFVAGCCDR